VSSAGKHFEHTAHRDSHTANRRFTAAHVRFDRDTIDPAPHVLRCFASYLTRVSPEKNQEKLSEHSSCKIV
jgi:hypothetical protein